nr:uncharacterized protein LOC117691369 isoform X1 [Crassostrea gigas]
MFFKWIYRYILVMKFYVSTGMTGCSTGYVGHDCNMPCRYPNYGIDCQSGCVCPREQCDHIIGCSHTRVFSDTTVADDSERVQGATYTFLPKIFYTTYTNISQDQEAPNYKSIWTGLSMAQKCMLISSCVIGTVFFLMLGIYMTWKAKESAVVRLYRSKWKFKGRRSKTVTSTL